MPLPTLARLQASTMQQLDELPSTDVLGTGADSVSLREIEDGSVAGGTNDATLRFNATNDSVVGDAMTVTHDATDGDSVLISKRGVYMVEFTFSAAASDEVRLGISADVAAAGLTDDPAMTISGMLDVGGGLLPAATTAYWHLSGMVLVTDAEAAAGVTVRAHGTDAGDGEIPDAAIAQNTDCHMRVTRMGDLMA